MTHEIMAMMEKRRMFKNRNTEKYKGVNQKKKKNTQKNTDVVNGRPIKKVNDQKLNS